MTRLLRRQVHIIAHVPSESIQNFLYDLPFEPILVACHSGTTTEDIYRAILSQLPSEASFSCFESFAQNLSQSGKRLVLLNTHALNDDVRLHLAYDLKALWDAACFVLLVDDNPMDSWTSRNVDLLGRMEEYTY